MKLHELQEDRLRPAAGEGPALTATLEVDNRSLMSTKERTKMIRSHNKRPLELPTSLLARPTGAKWAPHRSRVRSLVKTTATRRSTPSSSRTTVAAIYCSLPFVLLIILCGFTVNRHSQQPASGPTTMLAQAQFLFTYEINQESDESRVPRSSLFDPSSFKIVTPSQLQSSYQKLASQLPEPVSEHRTPAPVAPVVSATPETTLTSSPESSPHHHQHQQSQPQFQSLLEQPPTPASVLPPATGPSSSASFLKQTSAAIQSFAELFHLTPSSSPAPLAALQTPASVSSSQQQQPSIVATNSIDQQAEARSLHEHWTQQQKRAHNQAATGQTGPTQVSAFQSFTTPSTTIPSGSSVGGAGISPTQTVPTSHQQSGSQASYWLTSNPLNAPDGNFLVEIKNTGEQTTGNQESGEQSLGQQQQPLQQPHQNLPSHHHHHHQQQQQQQPPATTASSFIRPTSAHSSFLSTPTSTSYFGLPSGANQRQAPTEAAAVAPIHHHHHQQQQHHQTNQIAQAVATPTTPATTHVDRFSQQNFRKQATHFQPQTQALHQHQARSLSNHQQQQQHQQARQLTTPTSHQQHHHHQQTQSDLLEGQLQPPANTPEHYGGGDTGSMPSTAAGYSSSGSVAPIRQMVAPLKSAEESLIAFRQQQQSQHDQQGALLAAVQNQYAAQTAGQRQSNGAGELPPSTGNSLLEDELLPPGLANQPQHHHHQHHSLESVGTGSEQQRPKLPVSGLTSNTYSAMPQSSHQQQQQQQQQAAARQQQQQQQQQAPAEIPKVSPQIYESFLLQQKDQYEKHMELLKQQLELNKLLEQKQKQQQQQQQQEAEKRKRKKEELERVEARKKASAAREQELQLVAARKARQEAEEARRKQMRQLEEEEAKRKRASEEERRYRELMEAREREEAQRKRQEAEEAAELARRQQREQRERDALAEQQKRRREQQEAADEEAKQQQQYRNYMKQQEELKKLLELKQREDEAAQARQRQAGQILKQQQAQQNNRQATTTVVAGQTRANKLALEHKERARQISNGPQSASSGWGGRQPTRVRAVAVSSANHQQPEVQHPQKQTQNFVPNTSSMAPTTTTTSTTTTTTTPASPPSSSASPSATPRVGTRLSSSGGGLRRLKADEKLIRQKIPLYSGAGKYGLYQSGSNSDELAKLLEAVNLPPPQASTSASAQSTTSTSTTTTTTQATTSSSNNSSTQTPSSSSSGNYLLNEDDQPNRSLTSSSLSPLLNLRELGVTPPSASQAQARPTTGEPFSSTTIFDDDVPRRPVRQPASGASSSASGPSLSTGPTVSAQPSLTRRSFPAPISQAASSTSSTRTVLTNRMGTAGSSNSSSSSGQRGASIGLASLPADSDNDGIPGRAGHEYPILAEVPQTSFSCSRMKLSGFFADTETACQVVHLCQDGVQSSILCPNGTIFNQEKFSCQWWYEVNCARAPMFYQLNDNLYKSSLTGSSSSSNDQDNNSSTAPSVELNKRTRTGHHHHNHGSAPTSNHLKAS